MAKMIRNFIDRAFSRTVDLQMLHRLLSPYLGQIGLDWDTLPTDDSKRREVIFNLFAKADLRFPAPLQFALYNISTLATEAGARIVQEIASEAGVDLLAGLRREGEADDRRFTPRFIALAAYLDHRPVFDRALGAAAFLAHSSKLERDAERADTDLRHDDPEVQAAFVEAVRVWFSGRYDGHFCEVHWFDEDDLLRILVLHGTKAETKNVDRDGAEDTVKFREIVQSTLEYDRRRGAIAVGSKSTPDAKKLARIFGEHVMGDADIFEASAAEELYSLAPLQAADASFAFRPDPEGDITHVTLREIRIDETTRTAAGRLRRSPWTMTLRDTQDAIARLASVAPEIDISDMRIMHAKIDVTIEVDGNETVVPVTIRPPRTLSMRDHSHERLILDMLEDHDIRKRRSSRRTAAAAE